MRYRRRKSIDPNTLVLLRQILIGFLVLSGVVLLVTAIWYGTRVQSLTISDVSVQGGETIDHELIRDSVWQSLEGSYMGIIPRKFSWFYPRDDIYETVISIDRVHDVSIQKLDQKELLITFDEYIPKALWCKSETSDDCLFLHDSGFAFAQAPKLFGGSFLRFTKTIQQPILNEFISSQESFMSSVKLVDLLSEQGWFVSHIEISPDDDLFLKIVGGGELKVTLSQTPEETASNFITILSSDEFSHLAPGNFQYIDLRFGNKVFVNEELSIADDQELENAESTEDGL